MDFIADSLSAVFVVHNVVDFFIHEVSGWWGCWGFVMMCRVSEVVVVAVGFCVADVEGGEETGICGPPDSDCGSLRIDGGDREGAIIARH